VIIGIDIDGGRTRTRVWQTVEETQEEPSNEVQNSSNYDKFSTP
jgi:hypothetical protein